MSGDKWFNQNFKVDTKIIGSAFSPDTNHFLPINIGSKLAVALFYKDGLNDVKANMMKTEQIQTAVSWKDKLLRCRHGMQYEYMLGTFGAILKEDPILKISMEIVFRDSEVLAHKNSLPPTKPEEDDLIGLATFEVKTRDAPYQIYTQALVTEFVYNDEVGEDYLRVYTNRYLTQQIWKETSIILPLYKNKLPHVFVRDETLLSANFINETMVKVDLYDLKTCKCIFTCFLENFKNLPKCFLGENLEIIVTDKTKAYWIQKDVAQIFEIMDETITAVSVLNGDKILIGTYNGLFYMFDQLGELHEYDKTRDGLAIIGISHNKKGIISVQTMTDVYIIRQDDIVIQMDRPISSIMCSDKVIILSKYGKIHMFHNDFKKLEANFPPPEGLTIGITDITPWYPALYMPDESTFYSLMPDGKIIVRTI